MTENLWPRRIEQGCLSQSEVHVGLTLRPSIFLEHYWIGSCLEGVGRGWCYLMGFILDWLLNSLLSKHPKAPVVIQDGGGAGRESREKRSALQQLLKDLRLGRSIDQWFIFVKILLCGMCASLQSTGMLQLSVLLVSMQGRH